MATKSGWNWRVGKTAYWEDHLWEHKANQRMFVAITRLSSHGRAPNRNYSISYTLPVRPVKGDWTKVTINRKDIQYAATLKSAKEKAMVFLRRFNDQMKWKEFW